jgi:hypothetical protein
LTANRLCCGQIFVASLVDIRHDGGMEQCENCGRTIGKLETPMVYRDSVVCPECHARLAVQSVPYASPASTPPGKREGRKSLHPSAIVACLCAIPLTLGIWMLQGDPYYHLQGVGALLTAVGVFGCGGGFLAFAFHRMRE